MKDAIRATAELTCLLVILLLIGIGLNALAEFHPEGPRWLAFGAFIMVAWYAIYRSIKYKRNRDIGSR